MIMLWTIIPKVFSPHGFGAGRSSLSDCHPQKGSLNVRHLGALNNSSNYTAVSFIYPSHDRNTYFIFLLNYTAIILYIPWRNTNFVFLIFLDQHIFQKLLKACIVPWLIKISSWQMFRMVVGTAVWGFRISRSDDPRISAKVQFHETPSGMMGSAFQRVVMVTEFHTEQ